MEQNLDTVEEGKYEWVQLLTDFYGDFDKTLKKVKEEMKDEIAVTVIAAGFEKGREEAPVIPERPAMEAQPEPVTKAAVPRHTADFSKTADYDIPDFLKQK